MQTHGGDCAAGNARFQEGLSLLQQLGAVSDLPIYLYMHATMLGMMQDYAAAIAVVDSAIENANETGHCYWLAELHRCRAVLNRRNGGAEAAISADLLAALRIAQSQGAVTLQERARQTAREFGIVLEL